MRFRKSVKICKGLRVNLSKSGVSATVGGRGLSFNYGKRGGYLNTSILGTGLYNRHKIIDGSNNENTSYTADSSYSSYYSNYNNSANFYLSIKEDTGDIIVLDQNHIEVTDNTIIKKIKRTELYKEKKEELYRKLKEKIDNQEISFIDIYKLTPKVITESEIKTNLKELTKEEYIIKPFIKTEVNEEELYKEVIDISKGKVKLWPFWTFSNRKKEYIDNEFNKLKTLKIEEELSKEKLYYDEENSKKISLDKEFEEEFNNKKNYLNDILDGNDVFVNETITKIIDDIELPIEFNINFEYHYEDKLIYLDLDLPEIEDIPTKKAEYLSSGKLKVKEKSQKELKEDYLKCVCGLAFFFSAYIFNVSTRIENILVSGYTQRIDKKSGNTKDEYIYSILIERDKMNIFNFNNIDTILAFDNFKNIKDFTKTFDAKTIIPANNIKDILNK